ncbi:MAG: cobalamin-binding protein [Isosphaeraceae bacterium]
MRIVSLLPSLTELVHALGRGEELVGVTHECDYPPGVERLPHLTRSRIAPAATSAEIDALVAAERGSLYELNEELLAQLRPDLILTQEQCDVCAVNEATVRRAAQKLPGGPHVESVNPTDLEGVLEVFRRVATLLGPDSEVLAEQIISEFLVLSHDLLLKLLKASRARRRVALLEWFDPPYASGHWNPHIVSLAGGEDVLAKTGEASRRVTWEEIARADPDAILLSPCGFTLDRAESELDCLTARPEWSSLRAVQEGEVSLIDGSAYFSRPGPRLTTSLRIAAAALHPGLFEGLAPEGDGWRRLR